MRFGSVITLVLACLALALAGCGGGNGEDEAAEETPATETAEADTDGGEEAPAGESMTIEIVETDFAIDPDAVTVQPGTHTFHVTNEGETAHDFEVTGQGIEEEIDDLQPGDSGEVTVELTEPGEYQMLCTIHPDSMVGTVTVEG